MQISRTLNGLNWRGTYLSLKAGFDILYKICGKDQIFSVSSDSPVYKKRIVEPVESKGDKCNLSVRDTFEGDGYEIVREIRMDETDPKFLHIRLEFFNTGNRVIKIVRFIPLSIKEKDGLSLSASRVSEWSFFKQGRHKNDIPSSVVLGGSDRSFSDAVSGMTEDGRNRENDRCEIPYEIVSDELSILKGNRGEGSGSLLIGFPDASTRLVECRISTNQLGTELDKLEAGSLMDHVPVAPGESQTSVWVRLDADENTFGAIRNYVRIRKRMNGLPDRTGGLTPPSVYCTWYYYGMTVNEQDVIENLEGLKRKNIPVEVFQIDDGWERMYGDWEANEKFPRGMKLLADRIKSYGYKPGIWTCPFIVDPESGIAEKHPDWLLRRTDGVFVLFDMVCKNYYVLDVSHPEVQKWLERLYRVLTEQWGFVYHKLDFTRACVVDDELAFHNKKATRAEAYREGIKAIRRGVGENGFIVVCGGLYGPSIGLADAQRTGSDVRSKWPESGPVTIKQNVLRYWMNDLWFNDPDALMLRRKDVPFRGLEISTGSLTDEEAKVFCLNQYLSGGIVCFAERINEIDTERLGMLRHIIPSIGKAAIPRDMFSGKTIPGIFDTEVIPLAAGLEEWHTVAVINWSDEPVSYKLIFDKNLVGGYAKKFEKYIVSEFWSKKIYDNIRLESIIQLDEMKPHSAGLLKISHDDGHQPILIYSNGHYSMGGAEIRSWNSLPEGVEMEIDWPWEYPLEFIVRSPQDKKWKLLKNTFVYSQSEREVRILLPGQTGRKLFLGYSDV